MTLLDRSANPFCIHSSKAIGEPPFFLAATVFFAAKDAVQAHRHAHGLTEYYPLHMPATPEKLRMACADDISRDLAGGTSFEAKGSY